jgi:magnesium chelatase family protein
VVFADQAGQWSTTAIKAMAHILDHRTVTLAPAGTVYPADLQLVLASTTCPHNATGCACTTVVNRRYLGRLAILLDRIDVRVPLPAPAADDQTGEPTAAVAARVADARTRAATRWAHIGSPGGTNNDASTTALKASFAGTPTTLLAPLRRLIDLGTISRRADIGVLRLAWTFPGNVPCCYRTVPICVGIVPSGEGWTSEHGR